MVIVGVRCEAGKKCEGTRELGKGLEVEVFGVAGGCWGNGRGDVYWFVIVLTSPLWPCYRLVCVIFIYSDVGDWWHVTVCKPLSVDADLCISIRSFLPLSIYLFIHSFLLPSPFLSPEMTGQDQRLVPCHLCYPSHCHRHHHQITKATQPITTPFSRSDENQHFCLLCYPLIKSSMWRFWCYAIRLGVEWNLNLVILS